MEYYVTKPADYWIASNAITITLNALGDANRIQGIVASGAVIMCLVKEVTEGDGLGYGADHNPKRWPLSLSPTYFNSNTEKYVYVAIPRSTSIGTQAVVVFPSQQLDIYGQSIVPDGSPEGTEPEQIGSPDYFYVYLQAIISATDGTTPRTWTHAVEPGELDTAEGIDNKINSGEWYDYNSVLQLVTFLKEIVMGDNSKFRNLKALVAAIEQKLTLGTGATQGELTGVATENNYSRIPENSQSHVVTPSYLDEFGNTRYLSKVHDDTAAGIITFLQGLKLGDGTHGISGSGNATLLDIIFERVLKSKDARKGFLDGKGIYMDALKGLIEADGINVRGFMRIMELIINRLQLMESDYSFTEGDTTERVDFSDNGQRMVLTMHKEHDNDHTPFYPGDILYAKINDLLDHGTYYTSYVKVVSYDIAENTIKVVPYNGCLANGDPIVPSGKNFTFIGTEITNGSHDYTAALLADYTAHPDGYEKIINLTRMGNVANGLENGDDPTSYSDSVLQSQKGRQQAWVLSTTDKRLSFFWRVDEPIIKDENYALCLGILPDLANLPHDAQGNPIWQVDMPSLYVNTVFYDYQHNANYPAKVIKEDRGQWVAPDSTVPQPTCDYNGTQIYDPYHYRTFTNATWRQYRDSDAFASLTDEQLRQKMMLEFKVDLEISRVWNGNKLWECLVDGTTEEPEFGCNDWQVVSGDTLFKADFEEDYQLYDPDNFKGSLTVHVMWGAENLTGKLLQQDIVWTRYTEDQSGNPRTASDAIWNAQHAYNVWSTGRETLTLRQSDLNSESEFPSLVRFRCEVTLRDGANNEVYNDIVEIEYD